MSWNQATWVMLVASLTGRSPNPRMRLWRALKSTGAAAIRDGVYVLPSNEANWAFLRVQATEVTGAGGSAHVIPFTAADDGQEAELRQAFDRTALYGESLQRLARLTTNLPGLSEVEARRQLVALRRELAGIAAVDFFPGPARDQAEGVLRDAEQAINAQFSPDEPHAAKGAITRRNVADYRGRRWATRRHLWVDRVASAWLIHRFIDPDAQFLWLTHPADCPADALGFDFDGAAFTHAGPRVSFEVLAASFGLDDDPGLVRMSRLVHYLDVGGVPVADAAGFASVMTGARARRGDDDDGLLADIGTVLDCLYAAYLDTPGEPS
jgi:hypothetical protein